MSTGPAPFSNGFTFSLCSFWHLSTYWNHSFCLWHPSTDWSPLGLGLSVYISSSVATFLPNYLSLIPPSVYFLFVFKYCQEQLAHPCRLPGISAWLPTHWDGLFFISEEIILNINQLPQIPLPSRAPFHGTLSSRSLKRSVFRSLMFISLNITECNGFIFWFCPSEIFLSSGSYYLSPYISFGILSVFFK